MLLDTQQLEHVTCNVVQWWTVDHYGVMFTEHVIFSGRRKRTNLDRQKRPRAPCTYPHFRSLHSCRGPHSLCEAKHCRSSKSLSFEITEHICVLTAVLKISRAYKIPFAQNYRNKIRIMAKCSYKKQASKFTSFYAHRFRLIVSFECYHWLT